MQSLLWGRDLRVVLIAQARACFGLWLLLQLLPIAAASQSTPVTVIAPSSLATNNIRFGAGTLSSILRMQEVYGAGHFPEATLTITELRFRPDAFYGFAFTSTVPNLEIRLSTTARSPDALSAIFDQNVGPDEVVVFSGDLALSSRFTGSPGAPKDFDMVVPLSTPFSYTPTQGNLLLEIRNNSGSGACGLSGQNRSDDAASRVFGGLATPSGSIDSGVDALEVVGTMGALLPPRLTRGPYLQFGTTSNMLVRWRTSRPTDSRVHFGTDPAQLSWEITDPALQIDHLVALTNLLPCTRYYYAVSCAETNLAGGPNYFLTTSPTNGRPTRIWVLGDSGTAQQSGYQGLAAAVRDAFYSFNGKPEADVWLMLGDNAYLSATDQQFQTELFDIYPETLRRVPLWSCIGNHDYNPAAGFPYLQIFSFPTNGEAGGVPSGSENYYSFDYGNIHFVCLDSEVSDRSVTGPMLTWLARDLEANEKDWLIAFWHSPPYTKGSHDSDSYDLSNQMIEMRQNALPILEARGLDLLLSGHSHSYERSYLLDGHYGYSSSLMPSMIRDSGSGCPAETGAYLKPSLASAPHQGAVFAVAGSSGWVTYYGTLKHPAMFTSAFALGSMILDLNSNRLDAVFLRETGEIFDRFSIEKGVPAPPLRIATFNHVSGSVRVQWKSIAGQTYQVQRNPGLEPSGWAAVSAEIIASGATTGWTNAVPQGAPIGFYRVMRVAP